MKTKAEVLVTSIMDIEGLSAFAIHEELKRVCGWDWHYGADERTGKLQDRAPDSFKHTRSREDFRHDPDFTLGAVIRRYPWSAPKPGGEALTDFASNHGLTRVDWLALPYDEEAVMAQLLRMDHKDVIALPLLVFGFLNRASGWVHIACGLVSNQRVESATIAQFLAGKRELVDPASRSSTSYQHLVECLRSLAFTGEVLESGRVHLARSIRGKYGLSPRRSKQFVDIAFQEGWLDKIQLV